MPYDFPASPAADQEFTPPGGPTYIWKSPRWFIKGGTMGGDGSSAVVDWAEVSGKPATFPPTTPIPQASVANLTTDLAGKVSDTGDTMTGDLTIAKATPTLSIDKTAAGQGSQILFKTATSIRWSVLTGSTPESGGNVGSNFGIARYNDAGTLIDTPIIVNRANGAISLGGAATTTATNDIAISKTAPVLYLDKTAGQTGAISYRTGTSTRWQVVSSSIPAESGSNLGSNYGIYRFNDAGSVIDLAFGITRSTGIVDMLNGATTLTQPPGTNSTAVATTAFVVASFANLSSPAFGGVPTAPTAAPGTNTTQLATTAFVAAAAAVAASSVTWASITGKPSTFPPTVPIAQVDVTNLLADLATKAPLVSPAFTNVPTAPTATPGDNTTQLATTAFVTAAIATGSIAWTNITGKPSTFPPTLPITQSDVTGLVTGQAAQDTLINSLLTGQGVQDAAISGKVAKTGDTMSGGLAIYPLGNATITLNKPSNSGQMTYVEGRMNNLPRWRMVFGDSTAEAGGNAGSNFAIERSDDAGASIDQCIKIDRATGVVNFTQPPTVNSAAIPAIVTVADTVPVSPTPINGQLWWDSSTGNLYIYYNDLTSSQWIQVNATGIA